MDIPLLPVVMVLLGGTGILKCLSFLLQLLIVVTVWRKQKDKGAEFMSETSGLDNTMNWTYTVVLLAGAPSHNHRLLFVDSCLIYPQEVLCNISKLMSFFFYHLSTVFKPVLCKIYTYSKLYRKKLFFPYARPTFFDSYRKEFEKIWNNK